MQVPQLCTDVGVAEEAQHRPGHDSGRDDINTPATRRRCQQAQGWEDEEGRCADNLKCSWRDSEDYDDELRRVFEESSDDAYEFHGF